MILVLNVLTLVSWQEQLKLFLGGNNLLYHVVLGLLIGLGIVIAGRIVKFILNVTAKKVASRTNNSLDDVILLMIRDWIIPIAMVVALYLFLKEIRLGLRSSNTDFLTFIEYSNHAIYVVAVIIIASVAIRIAKSIIFHALHNIAEKNESVKESVAPFVARINSFLISTVAIIIVLDHFGQNIASILTILGAGSLALGLAAQDTISNMISGFIIMIDRPFRVGDRIKIPTGEVGDITEIGLRSTKILDFDNNLLIVPNNDLVKTRIINFSYPGNQIRVVIEIHVAYGSNIDQVKSILLNVARQNTTVLADPQPEAFFMNLGDWGMHFKLFCRVAEYQQQFIVAEQLRIEVYQELRKAKIVIPYPRHVFELTPPSHELPNPATGKKISRKDH